MITACGSDHSTEPESPSSQHSESHAPNQHDPDQKSPDKKTKEYCAQNQDPACPVGSYVGPGAILDPAGGNDYVPCEGTICTNPNHGAGDDSENPAPVDDSGNPAPADNADNG